MKQTVVPALGIHGLKTIFLQSESIDQIIL